MKIKLDLKTNIVNINGLEVWLPRYTTDKCEEDVQDTIDRCMKEQNTKDVMCLTVVYGEENGLSNVAIIAVDNKHIPAG